MISAIMGRYYYNQKQEADSLKKIQTWELRKIGFFKSGWRSGTMSWTNGWTGNKSNITINANVSEYGNYIQLVYTQTDRESGEKENYDYKIPLTTTPCYFGGKRFWFTCVASRSGIYCGRRVAVLYKGGDYFACRHCYDLTYNSRNLSGISKVAGQVISIPELERLEREAKRKYYKGKMTRKYLRFLEKERKSFYQMSTMVNGLHATKKKIKT